MPKRDVPDDSEVSAAKRTPALPTLHWDILQYIAEGCDARTFQALALTCKEMAARLTDPRLLFAERVEGDDGSIVTCFRRANGRLHGLRNVSAYGTEKGDWWLNGEQHGPCKTEYFHQGQMAYRSHQRYSFGKLDGIEKSWWWADFERPSFVGHWKDGQRYGVMRHMDSHGQLSGIHHRQQGMKHGPELEWRHGSFKRVCAWEWGEKHGLFLKYGANGKLKKMLYYEHGEKHGREERWRRGGERLSVIDWRDGQKHGDELSYDDDGKLQAVITWKNHKTAE